MSKFLLILIFVPFVSLGLCFSKDTTVEKSTLRQLDWLKVEKYSVDTNYVFAFSLPPIKKDINLKQVSLMFSGEELEYYDLIVDIDLKAENNKLRGGFVINEKYLSEAWLIISYEGCDSSYNIKISELISSN